ncbi:MAG: ATP-binding cassette domain-containing protein [bacterium]
MIHFSHVTKYNYQHWPILDNISFFINKGESVCLCGPGGSGKSTILKLIIMDEFPDMGEITLMNYKSTNISLAKIALLRRELGIIFEDFKLLNDRSIFENIALPLRIKGMGQREIKSRTLKIVTDVGLNHKINDFPVTLSGGEKQKCCIARALIINPWIILADEPTGNLDKESTDEIFRLLEDINLSGTAVLIATHNLELAKRFKGRVININSGKITGRE